MLDVLQLGPLALNAPFLFLVLGYVSAGGLLWLLRRRLGEGAAQVSQVLDWSLLAGLIGARLVFVIQFSSVFLVRPWTVLYVWQGGFSLVGGLFVGALTAAVLVWRTGLKRTAVLALGSALSLTTLFFLGLGFGLAPDKSARDFNTQALLRSVQLQTADGVPVDGASLLGQPMVLNFWATWCPPCRREMPLLDAQYSMLAEDGIRLVAVNVGEAQADVLRYLQDKELSLPVLISNVTTTDRLFADFGGQVMPTTYFIRADGQLVKTSVGELSEATLLQGLAAMKP